MNRNLGIFLKQIYAIKTGVIFFTCLVIPFLVHGFVQERGSFYRFLFAEESATAYDRWITHVSENIVRPGFNFYAPWDRQTPGFGSYVNPDTAQSDTWSSICRYFVQQRWDSVSFALINSGIPYDLVQFNDTDTDRIYYILRERLNRDYDDNGTESTLDDEYGSFDFGWGLFVCNPVADNQIIITVPHPNDDYIATALAWKAFKELKARYLLIAGAGREVMWTNMGMYTNNLSLSDPSRNSDHPMHTMYKLCCNEIRAMLINQNAMIKQEFSLQVHSYDSSGHTGYAPCQVSAGHAHYCPNLPIRDLSLSGTDLIHSAGYLIHPENTIGRHPAVTTSDFWAVYYQINPFVFNDGEHSQNVSNHIDLPGASFNCQWVYSQYYWNMYDTYDPFFHMEMDELPDCYAQDDSTLNWFAGWDDNFHTWMEVTRYQKALAFYTPWITALKKSLAQTLSLNDYHAPTAPVLTKIKHIAGPAIKLYMQRIYELDFDSWIITMERRERQSNGLYNILDTLYYDKNMISYLADQCTRTIDLTLPMMGYDYRIWLTARDKSGRMSERSASRLVKTYYPLPYVTDLSFNRSLSDDSRIFLTWTPIPDSTEFFGYRLERRQPPVSYYWQTIAILPPGRNSYADTDFGIPDLLSAQYRIAVVSYNGLSYYSNYCTGFLRCYPAPVITEFSFSGNSNVSIQWEPVTHTLAGNADTPDYYLVTKSSAPDFSSVDTQYYEVLTNGFQDTPPFLSEHKKHGFYSVKAMAREQDP